MESAGPSLRADPEPGGPEPRSAAGMQTPLSTPWPDWLAAARRAAPFDARLAELDVVVIGSGYGGSVAALRLAEQGRRVLVLERGSEFLPGEFPNHVGQLPNTCVARASAAPSAASAACSRYAAAPAWRRSSPTAWAAGA